MLAVSLIQNFHRGRHQLETLRVAVCGNGTVGLQSMIRYLALWASSPCLFSKDVINGFQDFMTWGGPPGYPLPVPGKGGERRGEGIWDLGTVGALGVLVLGDVET